MGVHHVSVPLQPAGSSPKEGAIMFVDARSGVHINRLPNKPPNSASAQRRAMVMSPPTTSTP